MNLWEILKTSKGLPPPDLETLLFARKISGQAVGGSTLMLTASGYPCVLEGSVGMPVLDYKIYGNSVQDGTPTPENPIEVQSVGDKTKNLFDKNDVTYGYWIKDTGDVINVVISARYNRDIAVITGKTICVRAYGERPFNIAIGYYDADNAFVLRVTSMNGSLVSTPPANAAYGVVYVANDSINSTVPITPEILASYKIMLTYGDSTTYEPYGYKIPVVVTGKNLFDEIYPKVEQGDELAPKYLSVYVGKNHMVTLSTTVPKTKEFTNIWLLAGKVTTGANSETNGVSFDTPRTTMSNDGYVTIGYRRLGGNPSNYETQLEFGSESTPYEPYHEPVTTNIYLDEPLRKIGDYADVIDFNRGVVERNTIEYAFTGAEAFWYTSSDENRAVAAFTFPNIRDKSVYFLNMFNTPPYGETEYNRVVFVSHEVYISLSYELIGGSYSDSNVTKLDNIRNWLKEQYESGNPLTMTIAYTSTTEPISLPSIPTFDGTTVISTNTEIQPSNMEIKYKARK